MQAVPLDGEKVLLDLLSPRRATRITSAGAGKTVDSEAVVQE